MFNKANTILTTKTKSKKETKNNIPACKVKKFYPNNKVTYMSAGGVVMPIPQFDKVG